MTDDATEASTSGSAQPGVQMGLVVLDTPDPYGLAAFYAALLGWQVDHQDSADDWVTVRGDGDTPLAFQLAPDLQPPTWPAGTVPQQAHLDLYVTAYDDAQTRALAMGARLLDSSDDHPSFRVYADPSGHPFCLCLQQAA